MDTDMDMESSAVDQDQDRTKTIINTTVIISTTTLSGRDMGSPMIEQDMIISTTETWDRLSLGN